MFFALSKILWLCLQPSSLLVILLFAGIWARAAGRQVGGRRMILASALGLTLAGLTPLTDVLIAPLENRFPRPDLGSAPIDGIIVLGGAEDGRTGGTRELMGLNEAAERMTETVALARRLPAARVVFSGGSAALFETRVAEAETAGRLFAALGIDPARLVLEGASRNTDENARFTRALIPKRAGERWLLVTSAWHMPRAVGSFRSAGFEPVPWPVDYRTARDIDYFRSTSGIPDGLKRLDFIAKEYAGLVVYWLTGRSPVLLPAP